MNARARRWFWGASIGVGLSLVAVVCVLLYVNDHPPSEALDLVEREPSGVVLSSVSSSIKPVVAIPPQLPKLFFPAGSVENECGLNDFPPRVGYYEYEDNVRSSWINNPFNAEGEWKALESAACWAALENHINAMDPFFYLLGEELYRKHPAAFVVLEDSLTFARIFADPTGDLARVQDALSRPECLLEPGETNWELKESCHADAFLNYALFNRFCFDEGAYNRNQTYYEKEDNPTPEQDRLMWKQNLEAGWIDTKCEEFDSMLELKAHQSFTLDLLLSLRDPARREKMTQENVEWYTVGEESKIMIELAARLGDGAAGLTTRNYSRRAFDTYYEEGYKYGRFAELLTSAEWRDFIWREPPTLGRFQRAFHMLARIESPKPDHRDTFELNWEWVARHLCEPPYDDYHTPFWEPEPEEPVEHRSCQEVVHEIRQSGTTFRPLLDVLDKFEQVALELEIYE